MRAPECNTVNTFLLPNQTRCQTRERLKRVQWFHKAAVGVAIDAAERVKESAKGSGHFIHTAHRARPSLGWDRIDVIIEDHV